MEDRKLSIEFIRIIAIVFTIMIHVSNIYFYNYGSISKINYLGAIMYNSFARICVPLFFMVSGIFLLKEEFNYKKYIKRVTKFLGLLLIWSIVYVLVNMIMYNKTDFGDTLVNMLFNADKTSRHLWFMYAIIGIYVALPFIQCMCKNMSKELENLFLILWMVLSGGIVILVPLARFITKTDIDVTYPIPIINATYYLGYFISGHILYERYHKEKNKKKNNILYVLVFIASTLITILLTYTFSIVNNTAYDSFLWYRSIFIIIASFMIFLLIITNENLFRNRCIGKIASFSFGIYLIHVIFILLLRKNYSIIQYNSFLLIPLVTLAIYLISYGSCMIIKHVPIINKMIK